MNITQKLIDPSKYGLKCPNLMTPIGICIHNTANDAPAINEINYMQTNGNSTSFHLAVDDTQAIQGIPFERNAWHAGDGSNGNGNRKYIGLEICYSKSGGAKFDKAEENAADVAAQILKQKGWGIEAIKKHQDFSGKYCPARTLDLGWDRFVNKIKAKLNMATDMYKGIDLNNKESVKVTVDTWKDVIDGKYIKVEESQRLINEVKAKCDVDLKIANDRASGLATNLMGIATLLGLSQNANPDQILQAIKALQDSINTPPTGTVTPEGSLPDTLSINGENWGLKDVTYTDGKLAGGYQRL